MQGKKGTIAQFGARRLLGVAFLFMSLGTVLELYLLDHYEDTLQLVPILSIGATLLVWCVLPYQKSPAGLHHLFKWLLGITALSGIYGTFLHLQANFEFEQEMKPGAADWDLLVESFSGALPALAPGSLIAFALIGYSYLKLQKET